VKSCKMSLQGGNDADAAIIRLLRGADQVFTWQSSRSWEPDSAFNRESYVQQHSRRQLGKRSSKAFARLPIQATQPTKRSDERQTEGMAASNHGDDKEEHQQASEQRRGKGSEEVVGEGEDASRSANLGDKTGAAKWTQRPAPTWRPAMTKSTFPTASSGTQLNRAAPALPRPAANTAKGGAGERAPLFWPVARTHTHAEKEGQREAEPVKAAQSGACGRGGRRVETDVAEGGVHRGRRHGGEAATGGRKRRRGR
jgi:hypothetical protein